MLVLNILAAAGFVILSAGVRHTHRTAAYSTYKYLEVNHVLVEKPASGERIDVAARLENIAGGGVYILLLGCLAAGACLLNGFVFFVAHAPRRHDKAG